MDKQTKQEQDREKQTTPTNKGNPVVIQHCIRLKLDGKLPLKMIKRLFACVKDNSPPNIIGSVQVNNPDGHLGNVQLVHRTNDDNSHEYDIPLTRHLLPDEFNKIESAWKTLKGSGEMSASGPVISEGLIRLQDGVEFSEPKYKELCEELAKTQHSDWLKDRVKDGWRYGVMYNERAKVHPMMKPWEELPSAYRKVDYELPVRVFKLVQKYM